MNDENKTPAEQTPEPPPEKTPMEEGRKNALLRYIAVLFAVAFLFVLLSLMMQMRDSRATISELNAASASALKNAEKLQTDNEELRTENADLKEWPPARCWTTWSCSRNIWAKQERKSIKA